MRHPLDTLARGKGWRELADNMFNPDGSVKLGELTGLAISEAARTGRCFTRQPSMDRAVAVREAVGDRLAERGLTARFRFFRSNGSYAVFLDKRAA
jgi:hypothetical protein